MDTFVIFENIRRFKALLAQRLEPAQRGTVEDLLAEEEATLFAAATEQAPCRPNSPGAEARPE